MARKRAKTSLWLAYDLGVKGDYNGLYTWLDFKKAKECSESIAFIPDYEHVGDLLKSLRADLKVAVDIAQHDRIYVIYKDEGGKMTGKFLFGRRKRAPWEGFAPSMDGDTEDEG